MEWQQKSFAQKYNKNERLVSTANLGFYSDFRFPEYFIRSFLSFMQLYLQSSKYSMRNYVFLCHKKHAGFVLVTAVTFVIAFSRYNVRGRGDAACCIEQNTPVMEKLSPESLIDDIQRSFMGPLGAREKRFLGFLHCIHYNFSSARCRFIKS